MTPGCHTYNVVEKDRNQHVQCRCGKGYLKIPVLGSVPLLRPDVPPVREQECDARGRKPDMIGLWDVARKEKRGEEEAKEPTQPKSREERPQEHQDQTERQPPAGNQPEASTTTTLSLILSSLLWLGSRVGALELV